MLEILGWILVGLAVLLVLFVLVMALRQVPEIRRYMKIRAM